MTDGFTQKFGGDPNHVVLGGDSAGAGSIVLHLTAFGGKPTNLFQAVIGESPFLPTQLTVPQARYQYTNVTQRAGCANAKDTLQCLRSVDISVLQNANVQVLDSNARQEVTSSLLISWNCLHLCVISLYHDSALRCSERFPDW